LQDYLPMAAHPTPTHDDHFEETEANEHLAEDSEAWNGVTGLLIFIVSIGLILAALTLYISRNP
jgi:hypothetical protein